MPSRRILLLSDDLMASSRIAAAADGWSVDARRGAVAPADAAACDVVLIDLQSCPDPGPTIAALRATAGFTASIVVFGPHVWRDRLDAALAAGADATATRGEVMQGLGRVLAGLDRPGA